MRILIAGLILHSFMSLPVLAESSDHPQAEQMADRVDELLQGLWSSSEVTPAETASDSMMVRRAHLDLTGVIPRVHEVREYLADQAPDKRRQMIDRLIDSPRHATHLANVWRNALLPDGFSTQLVDGAAEMQSWLRDKFAQNMRYDRIVGEFLTATGGDESGPTLYYRALDLKPEKLAASTARIFLGLQLSCAQCHDHPFDKWSQDSFWEYAAFFAQVNSNRMGNTFLLTDSSSGEVTLPDEDEAVQPRFPDGRQAPAASGTRRVKLSIWMSSAENPFLARATVNRVWAMLFGRGIVDPVDDLSPNNRPVHPELLDELAEYFVATGYDLNELFRGIAYSNAYALSSESNSAEIGAQRKAIFAEMNTKVLTAEQLYDSMQRSRLMNEPQIVSSNAVDNPVRASFVEQMETRTSPTHYGVGIQQTLHLMNRWLGTMDSPGIVAAIDAPFFSDDDRLDTLFLATLSRYPSTRERTALLPRIDSECEDAAAKRDDLMWALLNCAEYRINH